MAELTEVIDWGVATRPLPGEAESGDRHVVTARPGGVLVAVVDGLGHGPEAATAARIATATMEMHAGDPLVSLVERCHERLRRTRGAAMSLAAFDAGADTLSWLGVGNVEGVLQRADPNARPRQEHLLLRGGVVGFHLPPLRPSTLAVAAGDTLGIATDGIRSGFARELALPSASPQQIAEGILARYARETDDALVLVARYRPGRA